MFFNSIKKISSLRKVMNKLLNKWMPNIYFKVTIEEQNWRSQNFNFLGLKSLSQGQFLLAPNHKDIIES